MDLDPPTDMSAAGDQLGVQESQSAVAHFLAARDAIRRGEGLPDAQFEYLQNAVITTFEGLVRRIAVRSPRQGESLADLMQVGRLGLLTAMDRFDPERSVPFPAFAASQIRYAIGHHLRDNAWNVHVPRGAKEMRPAVAAARASLTQQHGRSPTVDEISNLLGITHDEVLQALFADDATRTLATEVVPDLAWVDSGFDATETRIIVGEYLRRQTPRDRQILSLGMTGQLTQQQIADRLGISQVHVSRRLQAMLQELGTEFHSE